MKSSNENQAGMGSRRVGQEARQSEIAREKSRTRGRGACQYEFIRRSGQPKVSNVFCSMTGSTKSCGKRAREIFIDQEPGHLAPDPHLFVRGQFSSVGERGEHVFPGNPVFSGHRFYRISGS